MATINVILQAKARDKGVHKWLTTATKLADGFADSLGRAKTAMGGLGSGSLGSLAAAGRTRGGSASRSTGGGAGPRDTATSFDKAMQSAQRSRARAYQQESRDAERQVAILARAGQQRVRASQRAAKNLDTLSAAQLQEIETQREITARRRRAARTAAGASLGADPTKPGRQKMGPFGKLEFAENLAVAGAEFEQFGSKVEQGIRGSFNSFKDYEKKVAEIGTITEAVTLDQIDTIAKAAVGEFGGKPIKQAEALQKVMSLGAATAADAQAQLMAANKLGIAGSADVSDSVMAISKSVANFKGTDAQQAADAIFAVTQASSAEVGDLAQALPRVAAGASMAGLTLQETVGTIGQLSNKLPDANQAVTGMIQMLSNIQKPTKRAREEAAHLGIDFSVAGIEAAGGWEEFLLKLRAAENFDEDTLAKLFDSSEARIAVAAITEDMEGLRKNLQAQTDAAGGTEKAYVKMTDTAAHKAALLEGQWETLKIQAGQELVPALLGVADTLSPIISGAKEWIAENPNLAATIAKVAIGTVVATKAAGALISVYSMWQTISAVTQLGNMKLAASTSTVTTAVTKQGAAMSLTSKVGGGMQAMVGAMPAIFAGAGAAIFAFNMVLDQAQSSLTKYEDTIKSVEEQQKNISFEREATSAEKTKFEADKAAKIAALTEARKGARGGKAKAEIDAQIAAVSGSTMGPVQKNEAELLMERRNRLISVTNSARTAASESRVGGVGDDANLLQKSLGGWSGLLNVASGVTEDLEMQARQAESDLAAFDKQHGATLGLGDQAFSTPQTEATGFFGETGTLAELAKIAEATQLMAANTRPNVGPSMESGLPS
jgi:TP901 family phage tail tape measure protein